MNSEQFERMATVVKALQQRWLMSPMVFADSEGGLTCAYDAGKGTKVYRMIEETDEVS